MSNSDYKYRRKNTRPETVPDIQAKAKKLYAGARGLAKELQQDVESIMERDPAAKSKAEVILLYSGLHAVAAYRVAHALHSRGHEFSARLLSQGARFLTGIEIHPGATIGRGLFIDHGSGVVIGETAEIGDGCTLYQGVTLGGTGKHTGKRHPTLGNNVMVGAGAKVLGPFKIGDNAKVAAGAVVLDEVPSDSTAVGIPAHVAKREGVRVQSADLDQVNIPDPVAQELARLRERIERLEASQSKAKEQEGCIFCSGSDADKMSVFTDNEPDTAYPEEQSAAGEEPVGIHENRPEKPFDGETGEIREDLPACAEEKTKTVGEDLPEFSDDESIFRPGTDKTL